MLECLTWRFTPSWTTSLTWTGQRLTVTLDWPPHLPIPLLRLARNRWRQSCMSRTPPPSWGCYCASSTSSNSMDHMVHVFSFGNLKSNIETTLITQNICQPSIFQTNLYYNVWRNVQFVKRYVGLFPVRLESKIFLFTFIPNHHCSKQICVATASFVSMNTEFFQGWQNHTRFSHGRGSVSKRCVELLS